MPTSPTTRLLLILLILLIPLLGGCASLMKGTEDEVALAVPEGTEIRNYTEYRHTLERDIRKDSALLFGIRSDRAYIFELSTGDRRDSVLVTSAIEPLWLTADIFFFPIALPVDFESGALYGFDRERVVFATSYDTASNAILSVYDATALGYRHEGYRPGDLGLLLGGHLGYRADPIGADLLGNDFGLFAGYILDDRFRLTVRYDRVDAINIAPEESRDRRREEATINRFALGLRAHVTPVLYGSAEIALLDLSGEDVILRRNAGWFRIPNTSYDALTTAASLGVGATWHGIFLEYRRELTLPPFDIEAGAAGTYERSLWDGMLWFGTNFRL